MPESARVSIAWPEMKIRTIDSDTKQTDIITGRLTALFSNGTMMVLYVNIPQVLVRRDKTRNRLLPWYWVDPCEVNGESLEARFNNKLPKELTKFEFLSLSVYAATMPKTEAVLTYNHETYTGGVDYPKCRISNPLGSVQTAEPVIATGVLTRQ